VRGSHGQRRLPPGRLGVGRKKCCFRLLIWRYPILILMAKVFGVEEADRQLLDELAKIVDMSLWDRAHAGASSAAKLSGSIHDKISAEIWFNGY
jgi:hypothetical protein